ncbi:MAG: HAD family hydrolase [Kiritimatiellia bacterium]
MKATTFFFSLFFAATTLPAADILPSWNEGPVKSALTSFIANAQSENSDGYIPPAERIAVFDNDGCLWSEQPLYFQAYFILDRVKEMASDHPEWKSTQPYQAILEGDKETMKTWGHNELLEVAMATHTGMTEEEFAQRVRQWISTAKHPETGMRFVDMTFQPMKELLQALRDAGFKTYIVSGGGVSFIRPWAEAAYGIPPEQVVGSRVKVEYQEGGSLRRIPEIDLIDDKEGKPVGIYQVIGRRPVFAAGNSDGDFQMLEYTTTGQGPRLGLLVHHTDADREFAYDRESHIGKLNRGLDEAEARGWIVVDMAKDWKTVYGESN